MEYWTLAEYVVIGVCMALVCIYAYKPLTGTNQQNQTVLSLDTSNLIKAICCVIIILHHYALRAQVPFVGSYFSSTAGNQALMLFMLMSGFGIVKSELIHKTTVKTFLKKRFLKLLIPFWIVNVITIIIYSFVNPQKPFGIDVDRVRVWDNFWDFGTGQYGLIDYMLLALGFKELDGIYWFLEVIVYSYVAFLITKSIFDIEKKRICSFLMYSAFIAIFGFVTYKLNFPAQYYRNLWPLILGCYIAMFEKRMLPNRGNIKNIILALIILNAFFVFYVKVCHDLSLKAFILIDIALAIPFLLNILLAHFIISRKSLLFKISGLSYLIYLWHTKMLNIEWYYMGGYKSVLIIVLMAILMSYLTSMIARKIE